MRRSKSNRLSRVKELLTPIKASNSPTTPASPSATLHAGAAKDADEELVKQEPVA
ncbi:MAG: hypothetical protein Q9180_006947, partial [Flavoplaca navasiana]